MVDLIIIGAGIAGVTAAIYAKNKGLDVLLFDNKMPGGTLNYINEITNYPGFKKITGPELASNLYESIKSNDIKLITENISEVINNDIIEVVTSKNTYQAKNLLIATGRSPRLLGLENELSLIGHGLSTCAICDGPLYRNKRVAIIGGGNKAIHDAIYLKNLCKEVYIINRRNTLKADKALVDQVVNEPNIHFIYNAEVESYIINDNKLSGLKLTTEDLNVDAVFLAIGSIPNTKLFNNLNLAFNEGYLIVDQNRKTNIDHIYAAGDCIKKEVYQLVTASSDGAIAALNINK